MNEGVHPPSAKACRIMRRWSKPPIRRPIYWTSRVMAPARTRCAVTCPSSMRTFRGWIRPTGRWCSHCWTRPAETRSSRPTHRIPQCAAVMDKGVWRWRRARRGLGGPERRQRGLSRRQPADQGDARCVSSARADGPLPGLYRKPSGPLGRFRDSNSFDHDLK
jgi:hypothetical protein